MCYPNILDELREREFFELLLHFVVLNPFFFNFLPQIGSSSPALFNPETNTEPHLINFHPRIFEFASNSWSNA